MSTYGTNSEIYKNNSNSYYTGRSGGNVGGSQVKAGSNEYYDTGYYTYDGKCATTTTLVPGINSNCTAINNMVSDTLLSYKASTTGNITGVYDMSGGAYEYVMGNFNNYSGFSSTYNSNFNGLNWYNSTTVTAGFDFPDARYYNLYTTSTLSTACAGLKCYGHALSETSTWYSDGSSAVAATSPWSIRGGDRMETTNAGIFDCGGSYGHANGGYTTRVVVALTNQ